MLRKLAMIFNIFILIVLFILLLDAAMHDNSIGIYMYIVFYPFALGAILSLIAMYKNKNIFFLGTFALLLNIYILFVLYSGISDAPSIGWIEFFMATLSIAGPFLSIIVIYKYKR